MAINDQKVVRILMEECSKVNERYDGFASDMQELLADIIQHEREHMAQRTNIKNKIADVISTAGERLAEKQGRTIEAEGDNENSSR